MILTEKTTVQGDQRAQALLGRLFSSQEMQLLHLVFDSTAKIWQADYYILLKDTRICLVIYNHKLNWQIKSEYIEICRLDAAMISQMIDSLFNKESKKLLRKMAS